MATLIQLALPAKYGLRRYRGISDTGFESGAAQSRKILELCTAINQNSRARPDEQRKLWMSILDSPDRSLIYLLRYHTPPAGWESEDSDSGGHDPLYFYTPQKMAALSAKKVHMINLSPGEVKKE